MASSANTRLCRVCTPYLTPQQGCKFMPNGFRNLGVALIGRPSLALPVADSTRVSRSNTLAYTRAAYTRGSKSPRCRTVSAFPARGQVQNARIRSRIKDQGSRIKACDSRHFTRFKLHMSEVGWTLPQLPACFPFGSLPPRREALEPAHPRKGPQPTHSGRSLTDPNPHLHAQPRSFAF